MRRTSIRLALAAWVAVLAGTLLATSVGPLTAAAAEQLYPLRVSANDHYLVDQRGRPFYVVADSSPWAMELWTTQQAEHLIDVRASQGFNTLAMFTSGYNPLTPNAYGQYPFALVNGVPDITRPNLAYFRQVDRIIQYGASRGIEFYLGTANLGSCTLPCAAYKNWLTVSSATFLGEFLGQRYAHYDNIIWNLGGDTPIEEAPMLTPIAEAIASGLRQYDTDHLITYHITAVHSSCEVYRDSSWLDFCSIQTYYSNDPAAYELPLNDYAGAPTKPTILIEPNYENNFAPGYPSAYDVRQATGWSALSGALGVGYGAYPLWEPTLPSGWEASLNLPGALQVARIALFLEKLRWWQLVPDVSHQMLVDGSATFGSDTYATSAISGDGALGLVYVPTQRSVTINMAAFSGRVRAGWFDPTTGSIITVGTFVNHGTQRLDSPAVTHADGTSDYFLFLQAPRSGHSA